MADESKFVYRLSEGKKEMKALLGGKGSGLAEMNNLGLPVPPGFTITTEACRAYMEAGKIPEGLMESVAEYLGELEEATGKRLGDPEDPLLVSVRSGAAASMPGMMDTVLNLGLNDTAVEGLARGTGDERFARDSYRRFIQMFADIVLKTDHEKFGDALNDLKRERGVEEDPDLGAGDLAELIDTYKGIVEEEAERPFPQEPEEQLELAIKAVFDSWNNDRAASYRREFGIPDDLGTAVTVMAMVFGNMGKDSATGVAFTRDPSTGEQGLYGEFLLNAQGEDVVAGTRTPRPLAEMEEAMPRAFGEILETMRKLERAYRDVQDIEFTVERDNLYMLQTRSAKRTGVAALKVAHDMAEEGLISRREAVSRIEPDQLNQVLHPYIDPEAELDALATGLPASPGAATGGIVLTANEAQEKGAAGEAVILVRKATSPDDVHGMIQARGILTVLGGMTSHAAVVARGFGKPAVTGCKAIEIDLQAGEVSVEGKTLKAGDTITIEGSSGRVVEGEVPLIDAELSGDFEQILAWADELRVLKVRANADTPADARKALEFGAEGIGLCRTEHMFMEDGRLELMRSMILSEDEEASKEALVGLEPLQRGDFEEIFEAMDGLPVTVRLLDPPLHEFLPDSRELGERLAGMEDDDSEDASELRRQLRVVESLEEANPMLGLRGCRLGLMRPEIYRMQVRAIVEAAKAVRERGHTPVVEIMIPLVGFRNELEETRKEAEAIVREVLGEDNPVQIGTMIELPRACTTAGEIAEKADFFSFGTNDLTQTTCGLSRDDAEGGFLTGYLEKGMLDKNPFETLDRDGVGRLVSLACESGRESNPGLKLGICGEHGGDPESIEFFHEVGLDYVSCSPYRVPIARLAAAQAAMGEDKVES
ncbi:MAG: pyruvate, phosphate dikinase [Actinomycetota bacterium]|nr:pyruvate, phosphate dikinase [Rubrobacteraceae bacterium]MDQ3182578.1 pyruvate, phosphate dikinase [Actinomycetota bacterium]